MCLITCFYIITTHYQLGITVDDKVRTVARKNKLAFSLSSPDLSNNIFKHFTVNIVFWLIDDEWCARLVKKNSKQSGSLLASRCIREVDVFFFRLAGAIRKFWIKFELCDREIKPSCRIETCSNSCAFGVNKITFIKNRSIRHLLWTLRRVQCKL